MREGGGRIASKDVLEVPERTYQPEKGLMLLGTIKGLVSERELVRSAIEEFNPKAVALHISPEEMEGLKAVVNGDLEEASLSSYEMVYAKKLSRFGEVQVPSPALVEAYGTASRMNIPILALDMDDEKFSSIYTETIGGFSMIRSSLKLKSINRKKFDDRSPEEFTLTWDKAVNGSKAYKALEGRREQHMASSIRKAMRIHKRVLCIIELERSKGIASCLKRSGKRRDCS